MPLPNRVTPFGDFITTPARGLFMGNRGGRMHDGERHPTGRRFVSRRWICCRIAFKNRHRTVWGDGYTELFFLDEPTALAAGHRPCCECRRDDARAFVQAWGRATGAAPPRVDAVDRVLHRERVTLRPCLPAASVPATLPDGTFVVLKDDDEAAFAVRGPTLWRWTPAGYADPRPRSAAAVVAILTPPAIVAVLAAGYAPHWHASAG
jgi:hypothetical protein